MNILPLRVALAQINVTVGDLENNSQKILAAMQQASTAGAHIVCLPELALTGYPPEDLLLKPGFVDANLRALQELIRASRSFPGLTSVIGFVDRDHDIYNAAAIISEGKLYGKYHKHYLPNYGVFVAYVNMVGGQDELVFDGGSMVLNEQGELITRGKEFAEDMLTVDLDTASVFRTRLHDPRRRQERLQVRPDDVPIITISEAPKDPAGSAAPSPVVLGAPQRIEPKMERLQEIYSALVLCTGDYVRKNNFKQVIIGLSGGIDSSLTATIAVDALGAENVLGISMPSGYSSQGSRTDAQELAGNLGIHMLTIPIEDIFRTSLKVLQPALGEGDPGIAAENLQARIRGNILMAISNKQNALVLTTGNKSEMATGYSTLYGDMAFGAARSQNVLKTLVYELSRYRNTLGDRPVIPPSVIEKPPSAELRPGQKDTDSLPPYEVLDPILRAYAEEDRSLEEIVAMGFDRKTVERVMRLVDSSEYKRRQAPPGVKITTRAFGRDRRLPITNRYRGLV